MGRVACLAMAIILATAMDSTGVRAGEFEDARAQAWFWSFSEQPPSSQPSTSPTPAQPKPRAKRNPQSLLRTPRRGPKWFWSFHEAKPKANKPTIPEQALLFSGADVWRQGAFLYGGGLWAPAGVDHDGFVVKLVATRGIYRYRSGTLGDATVTGLMTAATVMPGVHFTRNGISTTVYAGLDYQVHVLSPDDPDNVARGHHAGLRGAIETWYEPTPSTMLTASATLTTIGTSYAARAAGGWRLFNSFYLGPEALIYGGANYRQYRFGAQVTGLKLLWFEWQAGLGYAVDQDGNRGVYARVGLSEKW